MKAMFRLIVLVIVLGGWALAALSLHVVRLPDSQYWVGIVPKNRLHYTDTYLDVRNWTPAEIDQHPDFIRRVIATQKTHWLTHAVPDPKADVEVQLLQILDFGPPSTQPSEDAAQPHANEKSKQLSPRNLGVR